MKVEDMAQQFADNMSGLELTCSLLSAKDKSHAYRLGRYEGFLAGFKACAKERLNATTISDCPIKDDQLTKAIELLKGVQGYIENEDDEIEQFLKEVVK